MEADGAFGTGAPGFQGEKESRQGAQDEEDVGEDEEEIGPLICFHKQSGANRWRNESRLS